MTLEEDDLILRGADGREVAPMPVDAARAFAAVLPLRRPSEFDNPILTVVQRREIERSLAAAGAQLVWLVQ